jgi:hypothetical protein
VVQFGNAFVFLSSHGAFFFCAHLCGGRFGLVPAPVHDVISLAMQPGAVEAGAGCPIAPPPSCVLHDDSLTSYSTVSIACTVPPGVGSSWNISIRGYWVSLGPRVGYAASNVRTVGPQVLPITGGLVALTGANFGQSLCAYAGPNRVELSVTQLIDLPMSLSFNTSSGAWRPSAALVSSLVPCNVTLWSSTRIECMAPPGLDGNVSVRVTVGGQVLLMPGSIRYQGPAVLSFTATGTLGTAGGAVLSIVGSGFPDASWPMAVAVGSLPCALIPGTRTATAVSCVVPRGWGRQPIVVHTPLQASSQQALLQYDAPEITAVVTPSGRSIEGGFLIEVHGRVRDLLVTQFLLK